MGNQNQKIALVFEYKALLHFSTTVRGHLQGVYRIVGHNVHTERRHVEFNAR